MCNLNAILQHMVLQWPNPIFNTQQLNQMHATNQKNTLCTPAHAGSSTGTVRVVPVTGKPAGPQKRIPIPAAVIQDLVRRAIITVVARAGHTSKFFTPPF